jgi:hypothetical protein
MNKYLSELTDDRATDYSLWKVTKKDETTALT